jgi:hypothetical protein
MPLTGPDIYKNLLPKTNCGDCGIPSCFTFATMVVTNKVPLRNCPHIKPELVLKYQQELDTQHAAGTFVKRDIAEEALEWAKKRCSSMRIADLPGRIGGNVKNIDGKEFLEIQYFLDTVFISEDRITRQDGSELSQMEQVFIYNHMAQGGASPPARKWISLQDIPNSTPKIHSIITYVENPLVKKFSGQKDALLAASRRIGGTKTDDQNMTADLCIQFRPLPRIPVLLLFWDAVEGEGFEAQVKLLFDETIKEHLDIESIVFLSETLKDLLCRE